MKHPLHRIGLSDVCKPLVRGGGGFLTGPASPELRHAFDAVGLLETYERLRANGYDLRTIHALDSAAFLGICLLYEAGRLTEELPREKNMREIVAVLGWGTFLVLTALWGAGVVGSGAEFWIAKVIILCVATLASVPFKQRQQGHGE